MTKISSTHLFDSIIHALGERYSREERKAIANRCLDIGFGLSATEVMMGKAVEPFRDWDARLHRLASGEPLQYVMGAGFFLDRLYNLNPSTLIPRPETEELVLKMIPLIKPESNVLDVGTGSGCIAISLALATRAEVSAWDVSEEALVTAASNAEKLGARVAFHQQDLFSWSSTQGQWDIIVSNPPYVLEKEKEDMQSHVLDFEPHVALFVPNADPLKFYVALADFAMDRLSKGGYLALEINQAFGEETRGMLVQKGFSAVFLFPDFFGKDRMILAQK
jgi:release factor glutamine methyltransferase